MASHPSPRAWIALSLGLIVLACGGGSGDDDPDPPPPPPWAEVRDSRQAVAGQFDRVVAVGGRWLFVPVSESETGADRNGDGDLLDLVATLVDTRNDTSRSLQLALAGPPISNDQDVAFLVSEQGQNRTDLNGDGDTGDAVWFTLDPAAPIGNTNPRNLQIATPALGLSGAATAGGFVLLQSELAEQTDLTGDGDVTDVVPVAVLTLGADVALYPFPDVAVAVGRPLVSRNARVLFAESEPSRRVDLNGDGDQLDNIPVVIDFTNVAPVAVRVGSPAPRAIGQLPYALTDRAAAYFADEAGQGGFDLNTDGDAADAVLVIADLAGGGEYLPTTPTIPSFGLAGSVQLGIATEGDLVLFAIPEAAQGNRDLNGDMDTFDLVPAWVNTFGNPGQAFFAPLALSQQPLHIGAGVGVLAVSESQSGAIFGVDLNGDGDTNDDVLHLLRLVGPAGSLDNRALSIVTIRTFGRDAIVGVSEAGQNGDLNGDGDRDDVVRRYYDLAVQPARDRSLGIVASTLVLVREAEDAVRLVAVVPESQNPTLGDLTGDGDVDDIGTVAIEINPLFAPPQIVAPTPFAAGAASFFTAPPVVVGVDRIAWATSEAMANADLNEDGDLLDTVVRYLRVVPPE